MKKIISLIILVFFTTISFESFAQMSKKEIKEWEKTIKQLEPEQYKQLIDENKSLKGQVTSLRTELDGLDEQVVNFQSQISDLRSECELSKVQVELKLLRKLTKGMMSSEEDDH